MKPAYKIGFAILALGGTYVIYKSMSGRMISKKGLSFLTSIEGKKNKAYKDVKGLWTTGVGHLITSKEPELLTKNLTDKQVQKLLDKDLDRFEKVVKDTIKVKLKPYQKDALLSIAFNIGETGFKNSSLAKAVNRNASPEEIIKYFSMWDSPAVLSKRRAKEARLFLTGNYSTLLPDSDYNKYFKSSGLSECCEPKTKIIRLNDNGRVYKLVA